MKTLELNGKMEKIKEEILKILNSHAYETNISAGGHGELERETIITSDDFGNIAEGIRIFINAITDPENQPNQFGINLPIKS